MPRPKKCRKICGMPESFTFGPLEPSEQAEPAEQMRGGISKDENCCVHERVPVEMSLDEYETIRLIDMLEYTQEMCAQQMGVARTTVQAVYNEARRKLAQMLINGEALVIKGGNYVVCSETERCENMRRGCQYGGCCRQKERKSDESNE